MREDAPDYSGARDAARDVFDNCAEIVRQGEVEHVSIILIKKNCDFQIHAGGSGSLGLTAIGCAELLKDRLKEEIHRRKEAPVYEGAPANRVFYNCTMMPLAFDFLAVLLNGEMQRVRENAPGPLHVGWFWGANPELYLRTPAQNRCFHSLMRPMLQLIGAVEDVSTITDGRNIGEHSDFCSYAPIVEAYKRGEPLPKLVAPEEWAGVVRKAIISELGQKPVTITLREATHHPFRNSNLPEWFKLADWLEERGEKVVFVRDTEKADEPLDGRMTFPPASEYILARAALYQEAKCNLFVSNGPAMIPLFMDVPWMMFNDLTENRDEFHANTARGWKIATGIDPGGQWPWAKPNQQIVWSFDKFEPMRDAWLEHLRS